MRNIIITGGSGAVGVIHRNDPSPLSPQSKGDRPQGVAIGHVDESYFYEGM